jgi:signal transduction histidine kinase
MLRTVEDAVARMNKLLNQLKANATPRQPRVIDPNLVIDAVVAEFAAAKAAIEVRKDAPESAVAIDPDRLRSALSHLVQNAIEASGPGDGIMILSRRSGSQLLIEIIDSGPGMDAAFIRDELFLPFRSTKSGGYGIGAFQTRELIRMAGGDLEVISQKGFGTTMRVTLPLAAAEHGPASSPPQTGRSADECETATDR